MLFFLTRKVQAVIEESFSLSGGPSNPKGVHESNGVSAAQQEPLTHTLCHNWGEKYD